MKAPRDFVLVTNEENGVATLTLNRPEKGNAYDLGMLDRLMAGIERLGASPDIRAIVLRGAGKHFCVGGDLSEPLAHMGGGAGEAQITMPHVCLALAACSKPTIALVQGACVGAGFALVACCDLLLASEDSFFLVPELRRGFGVGPYIPFFVRALGARHARRYLISGERFSAQEALAMGVAHRLHAPGAADQALADMLDSVLQSAPGAIAATKRELSELADTMPTRERIDELQAGFRRLFEAAEGVEGRAAFRDKRPPRWAPKP
jgi:methylglutaconyl-CoA hydratase